MNPAPKNDEQVECVNALRCAILEARTWGRLGEANAERLGDLMDAVHNIPTLIGNWNPDAANSIKQRVENYGRKWLRGGDPANSDLNNMDDLTFCSYPYPIADTKEHPRLTHFNGELELIFVDYTNVRRVIRYSDVAFFRYSSIEADNRSLLDDQSYIIRNSSLIRRLSLVGDIDDATSFTHQIVCFNEPGQSLEIVYRKLDANAE